MFGVLNNQTLTELNRNKLNRMIFVGRGFSHDIRFARRAASAAEVPPLKFAEKLLQSVDHARHATRSKTVVDVHHAHI